VRPSLGLIRFANNEDVCQWSEVKEAYTGQNECDNSAAYTAHNPDGNIAAYTRAHARPNNSRHNVSDNARAQGLDNGKQQTNLIELDAVNGNSVGTPREQGDTNRPQRARRRT
jgi:hypothetical protein